MIYDLPPATAPVAQKEEPKDVRTVVVLSIFFGPLGVLYATITGALVTLAADIALLLLLALRVLSPMLESSLFGCVSIGGIIWAVWAVKNHNRKLATQEAYPPPAWYLPPAPTYPASLYEGPSEYIPLSDSSASPSQGAGD